ncbi:MAG: hypothetical protein IPP98_01785 [Gemmatimonadetes bacterium]|nr:hypothetical protein [Gemmatimonadota bacterium]
MRRLLVGVVLLSGCTWSNSLYQARRLAAEGEAAARNGQAFEAQRAWDLAGVKADSAYARAHGVGRGAAEALWVRGRSEARRPDCPAAIATLDQALIALPNAPWREGLLLELGRCRAAMGDPSAGAHFAELLQSRDPARRREAHLRAGHLAVQEQRWNEALTLLAGEDTASARVDRAVALSALGRTDEALQVVAPLLLVADSTVAWEPLVRHFAAHSTADADRFLERLSAQPTANDVRRSAWLFAAIDAGLPVDPVAAERHFQSLVRLPASRSVNEGRLRIAEYRVGQATSMRGLQSALDALGNLGTGSGLAAARIAELQRIGGQMVAEHDSLVVGKGAGDLTLFALAEVARDSLRAPALASSLWWQLEQGWPASPFVPKALMARMAIVPDSTEALRGRLVAMTASPYLAFARGENDPRFVQLEDSLGDFITARARRLAAAAAAAQADKE